MRTIYYLLKASPATPKSKMGEMKLRTYSSFEAELEEKQDEILPRAGLRTDTNQTNHLKPFCDPIQRVRGGTILWYPDWEQDSEALLEVKDRNASQFLTIFKQVGDVEPHIISCKI